MIEAAAISVAVSPARSDSSLFSSILYAVRSVVISCALAGHDCSQALSKSILFFEAQRSGYLPSEQRVSWTGDSGLGDGKINGVDLVGGYHDAGNNVKFGLPMAFTITMMSWSIVEYRNQMAASGELEHAMEAVEWGTDYLIKAHTQQMSNTERWAVASSEKKKK